MNDEEQKFQNEMHHSIMGHSFEHIVKCVDEIGDIWVCTCSRSFAPGHGSTGEQKANIHRISYKASEESTMATGAIGWHTAYLANSTYHCSCGENMKTIGDLNAHLADAYRLASLQQADYIQQAKEKIANEPIEIIVKVRIWLKTGQVRWEIVK